MSFELLNLIDENKNQLTDKLYKDLVDEIAKINKKEMVKVRYYYPKIARYDENKFVVYIDETSQIIRKEDSNDKLERYEDYLYFGIEPEHEDNFMCDCSGCAIIVRTKGLIISKEDI